MDGVRTQQPGGRWWSLEMGARMMCVEYGNSSQEDVEYGARSQEKVENVDRENVDRCVPNRCHINQSYHSLMLSVLDP